MPKTTQKDRILSISTPLGEDYLLLNKIRAEEKISELYEIDVELLYDEEEDDEYKITFIDGNKLIGKTVTLSIEQDDGAKRILSGMVNQFVQVGRNRRFTAYYATIVPHVWRLTRIFQSRIFQQKTVPDILKEVFKGYEIKFQLQADYKPRNYCVQYQESDFDFASRLMEEEGIYYYFEHSGDTEKLILRDNFTQPEDCPSKCELNIYKEDTGEPWESAVKDWQTTYRLQTGKVTLWDNNFQLPNKKLEAEKLSAFESGENKKMETYQFPAGYARKYDGINKGGGEQPAELSNIYQDNKRTATNRMLALDSQYKIINAYSDCATLTSGYRFKLKNHPNNDFNIQYIITSARHEADQSPDYIVGDTQPNAYKNEFTCIPHGSGNPEFRPVQKTAKPIIHGSQTAIVVGPAGEEIFTDKYGRVKVQFHWDRYGKNDESSSCWMRVAQSWAGNKWGAMFIPRINMEVVVSFLEGDPDQPIITGCVYQPDAMPPYTLPDEKTKSTIKSNSSKGGNGFNEFRFEDKKGSEQIFIHAEKNQDIRVKNDCMETIKRDRHLIVDRDQLEKIKRDKHLQVTGNHNEKIDGAMSLKVGTSIDEKAGTKYALDAGTEIHLKSGTTLTLETGTSLTLKVGGNFININPAGVFIKGTMVMINSGGAGGSGSGSSPEAPKDPIEADTGDPGKRITPPSAPQPPKPSSYSQTCQALMKAKGTGTAFVSKKEPPPKPPAPNQPDEKSKEVEALENRVEELEKREKEREEADLKARQKVVKDAENAADAIRLGVDPDALAAQKELAERIEKRDKMMEERRKKKND